MTITQHLSVAEFPSAREIIAKDSFRACSFAMDDGGRCLLDVISDPLLLQSFLESGSDDNSKDPQDGTSSESAVESPQIPRYPQTSLSNHLTSAEHVIESAEQMGYGYFNDTQGLLAQSAAACSIGISLASAAAVVGSSSGPQTFQHVSSSRATIHHLPTSTTPSLLHQHSPATPRPHTPLSHSIRSPGQGPSSVHSMPPPSPLQQTRSPLPSHTPSPAPAWSPAPAVLSPAANRVQSSLPSITFQQPSNQMLQTTANVTQILTALTSQQNPKFTVQQQQQQPILLHPQSPISSPQHPARLSVTSPVVTTAGVPVSPSMVQIIPAPQANVPLPIRTSHNAVRPIQPKLPQQILPKPATSAANQFVAPVVKQTNSTPVTASQRGVSVPLQTGTASQLVIGQGQPGMFSGPQGTILLNSIIPGMGQSPILIQGNLSNLANLQGLQLTLRPPANATSNQTLTSSGAQNNPTLIAALQSPNQPAQALFTQTKSPLHGQQTIVIPNNIAPTGLTPQNLNLTTTAIRNSTIVPSVSQGQGFLSRPNIILSPRVVGPNQGIQLQPIQTPQGPIFAIAPGTIAVPHLPAALQNAALANSQLAPGGVPMHGVMATGQGMISGLSLQSHPSHAALHHHASHQQQSLFGATVPLTSHMEQPSQPVVHLPQAVPTQPIAAPISSSQSTIQLQQQQENLSPKPQSSPKPSKVPCVNLEELLKEHGIVPENTPPPSPDSQSPQNEDPVPTQLQVNNAVVQSPQLVAALQSHQHVVLEQFNQSPLPSPSLPQMKFAFAQDGSVIFQPHTIISTPRLQHSQVKIGTTLNSSVIPTVTTSAISVPVVTTQPCSARGHSTLLARLNSAPAISIPDVVSSALASSLGSCASSSITTSTITTTTPMVIPMTVQSLNMNSSPISTSHSVQPFTSVSSVISGQIPIELCSSLPQSVNHTTSTTVLASQNVQNRLNHVFFGFQPLITSSHQSNVQTMSKPVSGNSSTNISIGSSHNAVTASLMEKTIKTEPRLVGITENNNGAIAPGHKMPAIAPVVPNDVLQTIQKEISDLSSLKSRTAEQQKTLQRLLSFQQNVRVQTKLSCSQGHQSQHQVCCKDSEVEAFVPAVTLPGQPTVITTAIRKNQMQMQTSHAEQMPHPDKQTNVLKSSGSQSIQLVNLLKQNSVHNIIAKKVTSHWNIMEASLRAITPVTISAVNNCDNSRITNVTQVTPQMRVVNPSNNVSSVVQQRHSAPHQMPLSADISQQSKDNASIRIQQSNSHIIPNSSKPSNINNSKGKSPVLRINSASRTVQIDKQLTGDQKFVVTPDTKTSFITKEDACQRLLKYHVYNSKVPSSGEMAAADQLFEKVSVQLLDRFRNMVNKYHLLQLKQSMKSCPTPEQVLLERLFLEDEKTALECDKNAVAKGKSLVLPPAPPHWLKELNTSSYSQRTSDESVSPLKEDCDLEAPVIDSCIDVASPPNDVCDRSPPRLKRIVIKTEPTCETENEDSQLKKRLKIHNSRAKPDNIQWSSNSKMYSKDSSVSDTKNVSLKNHDDFRNVGRDEDIMMKLRKELNISPLENEDEESVVPHVDFEPPGCANGLADFETPIARTDGSCDSSLLTAYNANTRTNTEIKYDFDMLDCPSEWMDAYANHTSHNATESEAAVESILSDHHNPSELDLSGIEGLEDHLDDSQQSIPNGIRETTDESRDSQLQYIPFNPKSRGYRESQVENEGRNNEMQDQMQSAIKSILEFHPDNRSYFDGDDTDIMPRLYDLEKTSHDPRKRCRISPVNYVSVDGEINVNPETDAALDEAVRSIMQ